MARTPKSEAEKLIGLNVHIPAEVHRLARAASGLAGFSNWDEAVTEALRQWARAKLAAEGVRR